MERRYGALRVASTIFKIIGFITLFLTVLLAIGTCLAGIAGGSLAQGAGIPGLEDGGVVGALVGIASAIGTLLFGGLLAVSLIAQGEFFDLLIAMEENTRATRRMMEAERREPMSPAFTPSLTPRPPAPPFTPPPGAGAPLPPTSPGQPNL